MDVNVSLLNWRIFDDGVLCVTFLHTMTKVTVKFHSRNKNLNNPNMSLTSLSILSLTLTWILIVVLALLSLSASLAPNRIAALVEKTSLGMWSTTR